MNLEEMKEKLKKNINVGVQKINKTKKDLEKDLNLGNGFLSKLDSEPGLYKIKAIADEIGVLVDDLAFGNLEEKFKNDSYESDEQKFIEKIREDTSIGKLNWEKIEGNEDGEWLGYPELFEERSEGYEESMHVYRYYSSLFDDERNTVRAGYDVELPDLEKLVLVNIQDNEDEIYELYMVIDEKMYPVCDSIEYNIVKNGPKFERLDRLWNSIEIDMPKVVLSKVFKKYTDENKG